MTQDNKLVEHAYNRYMDLKDRLKDLENEHRTLYIRYTNERDARQRDMAKKDLIINERRIQEVKQEMNKIKNQIHLKDSIDMLKLSGITVDADCESKDGGPGSGIKGHTTPEENKPTQERKSGQTVWYRGKPYTLRANAGNGYWLANTGHTPPIHIHESQMKDECGEKVYTKGTEDETIPLKEIIKNPKDPKIQATLRETYEQIKRGSTKDDATKDAAIQKECNEILKLSGLIS